MGMPIEMMSSVMSIFLGSQTMHLALFSGDPEDSGAELDGIYYHRQEIVLSEPAWSDEYGGMEMHNTGSVSFGTVTMSRTIEITHWGLFIGAAGNALEWSGRLDRPRTVEAGDTISFAAESLHCVMR